jgi:beta-phosphoglucomutase-like phosphatase (HAD superfamily)
MSVFIPSAPDVTQEQAPPRPGVRERLRGWRKARPERVERAGDDVQRRRAVCSNGRSMRVTGTLSAAATADGIAAPIPERGLGR